jgi:hypothetical protein
MSYIHNRIIFFTLEGVRQFTYVSESGKLNENNYPGEQIHIIKSKINLRRKMFIEALESAARAVTANFSGPELIGEEPLPTDITTTSAVERGDEMALENNRMLKNSKEETNFNIVLFQACVGRSAADVDQAMGVYRSKLEIELDFRVREKKAESEINLNTLKMENEARVTMMEAENKTRLTMMEAENKTRLNMIQAEHEVEHKKRLRAAAVEIDIFKLEMSLNEQDPIRKRRRLLEIAQLDEQLATAKVTVPTDVIPAPQPATKVNGPTDVIPNPLPEPVQPPAPLPQPTAAIVTNSIATPPAPRLLTLPPSVPSAPPTSTDPSIFVSDVAREMGFYLEQGELTKAGRMIAKSYRRRYNTDPMTHMQFIGGKERPVKSYTTRDRDLIEQAIKVVTVGKQPLRRAPFRSMEM